MTLITTNGVVIREKAFKDDRVLLLLTEELGVIPAYAKGAKRPKSKFASSTELLSYSQFVLKKANNQYWVEEAQTNKIFLGIREDLIKLALASYLCDLSGILTPREEPSEEYLRLLLNSLHLLSEDKRTPSLIKALFELRLMSMAGFMPDLVACQGCGAFQEAQMLFSCSTGSLCCMSCGQEEQEEKFSIVNLSVLCAMRHIIYSPFDKLFSFAVSGVSLESLGRVSEAYTLNHLDFVPKTLGFYHSVSTL